MLVVRRGSRINTDCFPKRRPKVQASRGSQDQSFFDFQLLKVPFLEFPSHSDRILADIGQISTWKVFIITWEICFYQSEAYPDLGSASSAWNFSACFSDIISRENQWWVTKCSLFPRGRIISTFELFCALVGN